MKTCALSDLHGDLINIEPCELVLICGDSVSLRHQLYPNSCFKWYKKIFKPWAEELPCNKVLFIAGNHEVGMVGHEDLYEELFPLDNKVSFLFHKEYTYISLDGKKYRIFGTPYCKVFGRWAYMCSDKELTELYSDIPENLDILMCHDQPYNYGDILLQKDCLWANGEHIGNIPLTEAIEKKQPRIECNGHLHSCSHKEIKIGNTSHYNVSIKDEKYQVVYKPLYLEI